MEPSISAQVADAEEKLARVRAGLEEVRLRIHSEAASFLREVYPRRAREVVLGEREVAERLTDDELRELKREVETIAARADEVVRRSLDGEVWWHLRSGEERRPPERVADDYAFSAAPGPAGRLQEVLTKAISAPLGQALARRGFLGPEEEAPGRFRHADIGPSPTEWPEPLRRLLELYAERAMAGAAIARELDRLRERRREEELRARWDSL